MSGRIPVPEIAARLAVGRMAVYSMLEQGIIPAVRIGKRWIVTRHAFENWERTCGSSRPEGGGACQSRPARPGLPRVKEGRVD
jgi:excisionase family DNA binding protein